MSTTTAELEAIDIAATAEQFSSSAPTGQRLSHYRNAYNKYGQVISVPVIDVRDGVVERLIGTQMAKQKQSRYIPFNRYHVSYKKDKTPS